MDDLAVPQSVLNVTLRLRAAGCVYAGDEARLLVEEAGTPEELDAMVERRATGVPLEQVVGWASFCGLRISVASGVFVPRLRSELMVEEAVALTPPGAVVVDLCCGSGALGAALIERVAGIELHATDIDVAAVRCAARNVAAEGGRVYHGDFFDPLPAGLRGRVDVVLANVPYVPTESIALLPAEARDHEPRAALDGGSDGLAVLRRVAAEAPSWLAPGGHVLVEVSRGQLSDAVVHLRGAGLAVRVVRDEERAATVVVGTRCTAGPAPRPR